MYHKSWAATSHENWKPRDKADYPCVQESMSMTWSVAGAIRNLSHFIQIWAKILVGSMIYLLILPFELAYKLILSGGLSGG